MVHCFISGRPNSWFPWWCLGKASTRTFFGYCVLVCTILKCVFSAQFSRLTRPAEQLPSPGEILITGQPHSIKHYITLKRSAQTLWCVCVCVWWNNSTMTECSGDAGISLCSPGPAGVLYSHVLRGLGPVNLLNWPSWCWELSSQFPSQEKTPSVPLYVSSC